MEDTERAIEFLHDLDRSDLASLLKFAKYRFVEVEVWMDIIVPGVEILCPQVFAEALSGLPDFDQRRIGEAVAATAQPPHPKPERVLFSALEDAEVDPAARLYPEVLIQRHEMIAVATGNKRIDDA